MNVQSGLFSLRFGSLQVFVVLYPGSAVKCRNLKLETVVTIMIFWRITKTLQHCSTLAMFLSSNS